MARLAWKMENCTQMFWKVIFPSEMSLSAAFVRIFNYSVVTSAPGKREKKNKGYWSRFARKVRIYASYWDCRRNET
jgi:hypothetical protein